MNSISFKAVCLIVLLALFAIEVQAQTTEFTYQGALSQNGSPADGMFNFEFALFDALNGGSQQGLTLDFQDVAVVAGVFTVNLDFGDQYPGADRYLQIWVSESAGAALEPSKGMGLTALSPRQKVESTPYAVRSLTTAKLGDTPAAGFIFNSNSLQIDSKFYISGTGRANLLTANSMGVGTNTPSNPLHVASDVNIPLRVSAVAAQGEDTGIEIVGARNGTPTANAAYLDFRDFDSDELAGTEFTMARISAGMADASGQTGNLRFFTNEGSSLTERVRIEKNGHVGIPGIAGIGLGDRLSVAGDVAVGGGTTIGLEDGGSEYLRIRGFLDDWYLGVRNIASSPQTNFFIGKSDIDYNRFHFSPAGDLGLGTAPTSDLHLASTGSLELRLEADSDNSGESDQPSILLTQDGGIISGQLGFFDNNNSMSLRTSETSAGTPHILLEPKGRVGIGLNAPQNKLDVHGAGTSVGGDGVSNVVGRFRQTTASGHTAVSIDALDEQDAILFLGANGSAVWGVRNDIDHPDYINPVFDISYQSGTNYTAMRIIKATGSSFTIAPGADDAVTLGSGFSGAWKSITTYALTNLSDARLKDDIQELGPGIDEIMNLHPVQYRWKARPQDGSYFGVVAQDVQEVIPEIVKHDKDDPEKRLTVDYLALIPVLINGLQDQQREIDSQRQRIDELESALFEMTGLKIAKE